MFFAADVGRLNLRRRTVLPVHRRDLLVGRQARGVRKGDQGHGGRQGHRGSRLLQRQDQLTRGRRRLRPDLLDYFFPAEYGK